MYSYSIFVQQITDCRIKLGTFKVKLTEGSLFCLFLKLVQINFIFTDNVRILYIYFYGFILHKHVNDKSLSA
jgi:hypothetical protein